MLRNLATSEQRRLLDCYNNIWWSGQVPEAWRTAIVAPILKSNKPANELSSYRPVSLTSAACKVMEAIALARLEWVARACGFLADQQTGFRRRRCTADSIADVVSTLEDARASGDLAMLLLIDVKGAFDGLPHAVVQQALDLLGIGGNLRRFLSSFLNDRTLRVRVGHARSTPRPVAAGVPQGSVVSPFLFNLALAGFLLHCRPTLTTRWSAPSTRMTSPCGCGDRRSSSRHVCLALQRAPDTTAAYLGSIGLSVTVAKALLKKPPSNKQAYSMAASEGRRRNVIVPYLHAAFPQMRKIVGRKVSPLNVFIRAVFPVNGTGVPVARSALFVTRMARYVATRQESCSLAHESASAALPVSWKGLNEMHRLPVQIIAETDQRRSKQLSSLIERLELTAFSYGVSLAQAHFAPLILYFHEPSPISEPRQGP
ncbi:hypothetical protein HPB49_018812 [Dermacentor silvarum]|uniref:Uncharacterized protein n=1 Tax=Dermacentor silvarum TaxID=543639 RepID=A0ACB8C4Z7_DERSI|nr:hypothetical protein HPB49_018812 [Dermacentor silvarum]